MKRQLLSVVFVLTVFFSLNAHGATLDVRSGQLFGAFDVDVNGILYDVQFRDGTCIELYGGCDEQTDFPFTNPLDPSYDTLAVTAAQALRDQVFIDSPLGAFDSSPNLTNGIDAPAGGYVHTPLWTDVDSGQNSLITLSNFRLDHLDRVFAGGGTRDLDTRPNPLLNNSDRAVFAVWSNATPVPVPPSLLLFFSGTVGLLGYRGLRKNRHPHR